MNIVLASVDCARPDALTHRFFEVEKSRGAHYDTCIVQAPFTSPSHCSILSGQQPFNHGVRWLVDYDIEVTLLPEILSDEGYTTAAFVGGYPLPTGNLDASFDEFEHVTVYADEHEGRQEFGPANLLVNRAVNWLENHEDEDTFVFLHLFDLHFTLRSEFGGRDPPSFDDEHVYENVEQYIGRHPRRYYEEADEVGRQLELLDDLVDIDTWVITGDHGSKMPREHGYPWVYDHRGRRVGSQFRAVELYDEQIRVPLIIEGPAFPNTTVHEQVRSIDIVPTLLDGLGIDTPIDVDGQSLFSGDHPQFAYSETYHGQLTRENKLTHQMNERYDFGWNELDSLICLRSNEWKLICTANGDLEPTELYHIGQDPAEYKNLIGERPGVVEDLFDLLLDRVGGDEQRFETADSVDDDVRGHLEDLGYL